MEIRSLGVVGAGTMGNGIAQVSAAAGLPTVLVDVAPVALEKGLATLERSL
jgi:3-hydroxybutyryl-CoA dehydrogenase